ncbi:hypothetical protein BDQ17DRAFT_1348091 [Cyathus striatus]|nr:hypothetical protein BDQ17DRAFT_1348091 [Cyathus striatus]
MAPKEVTPAVIDEEPEVYENRNVHMIYDDIASHFSSTRYKPWPIIANFISSIPVGWIGLDSGTGNGKYLPLPLDRPGELWTIGLDRSINLLKIARTAGSSGMVREVVWGNVLDNAWRPDAFDYAISIATIHHLATHDRRRKAIERLIQAVATNHGRVLIYVWAIEQDELSKRKIPTVEDGHDGHGKDVVVPWVFSTQLRKTSQSAPEKPQTFNRYYHMFAKGELSGLVAEAARELGLKLGPKPESSKESVEGLEIIQNGWERSNYYVELKRWTI